MTTRPNPYVGPRAFDAGTPLYGRARELRQLKSLLVAERIVLLHSPSGAGKTSLIQAGLIPVLSKSFNVLPIVRVNLEPPAEMCELDSFNRYIFSTLVALEENQPVEQRLPAADLATLGLNAYIEQRLPPGDMLLIFDQFEEILTIAPSEREAKAAFFAELGLALRNPDRWALFAMREDFIGALDPYLRPIPGQLESRYRLDLLKSDAAREAIQLPPQQQGVTFSEAAAEKLIRDLSRIQTQDTQGATHEEQGEYVEPVLLQVVCFNLWQNLRDDAIEINEANLIEVGSVDEALSNYYQGIVVGITAETGASEHDLRNWFQNKLLTGPAEQPARGQVRRDKEKTEGLVNSILEFLIRAHIIRGEARAGGTWYELAHDRLIKPICKNNQTWFDTHPEYSDKDLRLSQMQQALLGKQLLGRKDFDEKQPPIYMDIYTDGGAYIEGDVLSNTFIGRDYIQGDLTTSAEQRATTAHTQIMDEIIHNFNTLSVTLWGLEEHNAPQPFWDIRRANESELAYQDRAKESFRIYLTHLHTVIGLHEFSTAVYDSFKRDLAHSEYWATHIKNVYGYLKDTLDTFQRLEQGLQHILSLSLTDRERTLNSLSVYKEMLLNAKIGLTSALAEVCLVIEKQVDLDALVETFQLIHIDLSLQLGKVGWSESLRTATRFAAQKTDVLRERSSASSKPANREIERHISDPYLLLLRSTVGLPAELTDAEIRALERKEIDLTEQDPQKLIRLAAFSFTESDSHASLLYLRRAIEIPALSSMQQKFVELSIHRIEHPDIYQDSLGMMIFRVTERGNFDRAGIKVEDVLVSINGITLIEPMDIAYELAGNDPVLIGLVRDGKYSQVVVQGGESAGAALSPLIIIKALQL